ncbi:hypothetical protein [Curvivirga aplysinae]|uniref:hypothetical protein n=1 Tax=Curvivirga aplysinae TaxID=2529852 RepID=UPI0012BD2683|nr:hypothetical protein [Curvivirga aplysinae]MTI11329.1 hypothetical protein [Curvivirga aplysinae]
MRLASVFCSIVILLTLSACNDTESKDSPKANLLLDILDISFSVKDGRQVFSHTRVFRETNGVDLVITRGKICVESKKTCVDAFLEYEVEAYGKLIQNNHHVATRQGEDEITFEYWAKDENGHEHKISKTLIVDGEKAAVKH